MSAIHKIRNIFQRNSHQNIDDDNFAGRVYEINNTLSFFKSHFNTVSNGQIPVVIYHGEGGIGKTFLCKKMHKELEKNKISTLGIIDFKETTNQSILSIIKYISENVDDSGFKIVVKQIKNYENTKDLDKLVFLEQIHLSFHEAIDNYKQSLVIIADNLQVVKGTYFWDLFLAFMEKCNGKCGFILAGHEDILFSSNRIEKRSFEIRAFLDDELKKYSKLRQKKLDTKLGKIDNIAINKIFSLTKGRPIFCALTFDWIIDNNTQIDYITNLPEENFKHELIRLLNNNSTEVDILKIMPYINKRLNPEIIKIITEKSIEECVALVENLKRFSFVKISEMEESIILHDEIQKLIKDEFLIQPNEILSIYAKVLKYYENKQVSNFKIEKLYYLLRYDVVMALEFLEQEFQKALDIYDYNFCGLLLEEANRLSNEISDTILLLNSKLLICQYKSTDAMKNLKKLHEEVTVESNKKLYAAIYEAMGECLINHRTMEDVNIFEAVEYFNTSYLILKENNIETRMPYCLFGLGKAYVYTGQYTMAEKAFTDAAFYAEKTKNYSLMVKILDEKSKILRLQQKFDKSLIELHSNYNIRKKYKLTENQGVFYYYLANTYRDLKHFIVTEYLYSKAEKMLLDVNDKFSLCELYSDLAWFEYLRNDSDFAFAEKYMQKAENIAKEYKFGVELSECAHIRYEVSDSLKNYELADRFLDEALEYAYKYSNIFMILDCLNHDAQRAYRLNNFDKMTGILQEMMKYEELGCEIKVFRGRALLTNGDFYLLQEDFKSTYENWFEGFCIIALGGNSRSNNELFDDLFNQRKDKFKEVLNYLGKTYKDKFKRSWKQKRISQEFDYVLQICE